MRNDTATSWLSQLSCMSARTSHREQPSDAVAQTEEMEDHDRSVEPLKSPDGWTRLIHPDGTPYFVHEAAHIATADNLMDKSTMDAVTKAVKEIVRDTLERRDIYQAARLAAGDSNKSRGARCPKILRMIEGDVSLFDPSEPSYLRSDLKLLPPDCELWVSLQDDPTVEETEGTPPRNFAHHFMAHATQSLLFIPRDANRNVRLVSRTHTSESTKRPVQYPYWESFSKRPMHRPIPSSVEDELLSALVHYASVGVLYKPRITSPFSVRQCEQLISLHQTLKHETSEIRGVRAWFASVVMYKVWEARHRYDFGSFSAPEQGDPVEADTTFTFVDLCLLVLCFGAHGRYRTRLNLAHTKGGVHVRTLHMLMAGSVQEWTDSNLLATVFVSANMAFLAVPSIQGTQKTFVLVSTLFAMASIIGGVHHLWKHRPKSDVDSEETPHYLYRAVQKPSRIIFTSVFLCLPLVFLLWSVISFAIALLHFSFRTNRGLPLVFLACVAGVIILTTICVRVFFYSIWDEPDKNSIFKRIWHARNVIATSWKFVKKWKGSRHKQQQLNGNRQESIASRIRRVFDASWREKMQDLP